MPKLSLSISKVSVDGLKLVILSADFLLNLSGASILSWSVGLLILLSTLLLEDGLMMWSNSFKKSALYLGSMSSFHV